MVSVVHILSLAALPEGFLIESIKISISVIVVTIPWFLIFDEESAGAPALTWAAVLFVDQFVYALPYATAIKNLTIVLFFVGIGGLIVIFVLAESDENEASDSDGGSSGISSSGSNGPTTSGSKSGSAATKVHHSSGASTTSKDEGSSGTKVFDSDDGSSDETRVYRGE